MERSCPRRRGKVKLNVQSGALFIHRKDGFHLLLGSESRITALRCSVPLSIYEKIFRWTATFSRYSLRGQQQFLSLTKGRRFKLPPRITKIKTPIGGQVF